MSSPSARTRKLEAFRRALRKELAALFHVEPSHPGIERILEETETHLEDAIAGLVENGAPRGARHALSRFGTASRVARAYRALKPPTFIDPQATFPAGADYPRLPISGGGS
jgi:hypothetical protein